MPKILSLSDDPSANEGRPAKYVITPQVLAYVRGRLVDGGFGDDEILSSKELCAWLNLSYAALVKMRELNEAPPHIVLGLQKFGYRAGDIKKWIANGGRAAFAKPDAVRPGPKKRKAAEVAA